MFHRILVIRGGAVGDFVLTLPALKALRDQHPTEHIEILGYRHIAALAEKRFYAQAIRSIEYGPLSSFFARNSELPPELADYFASFDAIISYLYDPDNIFESNLRRSGAQRIVPGPPTIGNSQHAARQLAQPVQQLGIEVKNFAAELYPSKEDRDQARKFLGNSSGPLVALHPGSGSEKKNWPLESWIEIGNQLLSWENFDGTVVVVAGEADQDQVMKLDSVWKTSRVLFAKNLPLPQLAAVLEHSVFVGHDSGISHLAAAAGASCILLFGPTNPCVWAPCNENVRVLQAPNDNLRKLGVDVVRAELAAQLSSSVTSALP
jgi:heptosyltransferase III